MIMCRKSTVDWFTSLIEYTDSGWELCGSALMPPQFPLVLCQEEDFAPVMPDCYITIAAGFLLCEVFAKKYNYFPNQVRQTCSKFQQLLSSKNLTTAEQNYINKLIKLRSEVSNW